MIPPRIQDRGVSFRLTESALTLFEGQGYEATTADQIAARAGISRRAIFNYYASLDDVIFSDYHLDFLPALRHGLALESEPFAACITATLSVASAVESEEPFYVRRAEVIARTPALQRREALWQSLVAKALSQYLRSKPIVNVSRIASDAIASGLVASLFEGVLTQSEDAVTSRVRSLIHAVITPYERALRASTRVPTRAIIFGGQLTEKQLREIALGRSV